jgi:hypothetical protein
MICFSRWRERNSLLGTKLQQLQIVLIWSNRLEQEFENFCLSDNGHSQYASDCYIVLRPSIQNFDKPLRTPFSNIQKYDGINYSTKTFLTVMVINLVIYMWELKLFMYIIITAINYKLIFTIQIFYKIKEFLRCIFKVMFTIIDNYSINLRIIAKVFLCCEMEFSL